MYSLERGRVYGHAEIDNGDAGQHHGQLAEANGATDALVLLGYQARLVLATRHVKASAGLTTCCPQNCLLALVLCPVSR